MALIFEQREAVEHARGCEGGRGAGEGGFYEKIPVLLEVLTLQVRLI